MSDSDRLERAIARLEDLNRLTGTGRRVLNGADARSVLALLLREVAETVLPRCLSVKTEAETRARIEVAGGRILALETDTAVVSGRGQFGDVDAFARALGTALRDFAGEASSLTLASTRLARRPGPDDLRCPPDRVPIDTAHDDDAGGLAALARALARAPSGPARAWVLTDSDGTPVTTLGDRPDLDRLARFAAAVAPAIAAELDRLPGGARAPGCLVCATDDGSGLLYARAAGAVLAMWLPAPALAGLAALWQRHCGG